MTDAATATGVPSANVPVTFTADSNHTPSAKDVMSSNLTARDFKDAPGWRPETQNFATYGDFLGWYTTPVLDADGNPAKDANGEILVHDRRASVQAVNFDIAAEDEEALHAIGPINVSVQRGAKGTFPILFLTHMPDVDDILKDTGLSRTLASLGATVRMQQIIKEIRRTLKTERGMVTLASIDLSPSSVLRAMGVLMNAKRGQAKLDAFAKQIFTDTLDELAAKVKGTAKEGAFNLILAELKGHLSVPKRPTAIITTRDALRQTTPDHIDTVIVNIIDKAIVAVMTSLADAATKAESDEVIYATTPKKNNKTLPLAQVKEIIAQRPHTSYVNTQVGTSMDDLAAILAGKAPVQTIEGDAPSDDAPTVDAGEAAPTGDTAPEGDTPEGTAPSA